MTDRVHSLTVVLKEDTRVDDVESISNAIRMVRGVISVEGNVADSTSYMAEERARQELGRKLLDVVFPRHKDQ